MHSLLTATPEVPLRKQTPTLRCRRRQAFSIKIRKMLNSEVRES